MSEPFHNHPEEDALPSSTILRVLFVTVISTVALCLVAYLLLVARSDALRPGRQYPEHALRTPDQISGVKQTLFNLAINPDLARRDRQRAQLSRYGWLDADHRLLHIPIERAMEILVAEPERLEPKR